MLMSKNRFINTKFWSDSFIIELNPLDRYLFLYFLTNEHTNIAGIYELPLRTISFETGIEKDMLEKMIRRLNGKIYYIDGWVYIKNFEKHNNARGHSKVKIGIENAKKEIPSSILDKIANLSKNSIPLPYTIQGGCDSDLDSDSDSDSDSDLITYVQPTVADGVDGVNEIFNIFYKINPTINFQNKTQRKIAKELIAKFGKDKIIKMATYAVEIFGQQFSPTITTPLDLKNKMSKLAAYFKKQENNNQSNMVSI